jgi:hypothetical protein
MNIYERSAHRPLTDSEFIARDHEHAMRTARMRREADLRTEYGEEPGCTMTRKEILQGIDAMQRVQMNNPPSSEKWQRASEALRKLAGLLNRTTITPEMWDAGVTEAQS